jgi:TorA maturation chaperone TorD
MEDHNETAAHDDNWAEILTGEALAFSFLNIAFHEKPNASFIDTLISEDVFAHWPLNAADEYTTRGLETLQDFSRAWQSGQLAALKKDYQQLFIGPHSLPAPPWESVYLSVEHLIFESQTTAVREFYGRYGLQVTNLYKEPDDHFGLEMAFLAHLCGLGLEAIRENNAEKLDTILAAQREFLEEHPLLWAPDFLHRVASHAQTPYYRGVAWLALGTLGAAAQLCELDVNLTPQAS